MLVVKIDLVGFEKRSQLPTPSIVRHTYPNYAHYFVIEFVGVGV